MSREIMKLDRWVGLPSDLLHEIGKHLLSPKDYVRFGATSKSWNLSLPKTPNHIRGPLLVLPFNHETYDIKEEKDFYLRLPELQNNILLCGSCFGWLISVGIDGVVRMLSPFSNAYLDLPPLSTVPCIVDHHPDWKDEEYTVMFFDLDGSTGTYFTDKRHVHKMCLMKIVISSSPEEEDLMALTIYGEHDRLAWCKFGDTKWTEFSTPEIISPCIQDAIFYEAKVYAIGWEAQLYVFDLKTSSGGISEVPKPDDLYFQFQVTNLNIKYLVRSVEGNLLMAVRFLECHKVDTGGEYKENCLTTDKFQVYRLDKSAKKWTRILSLGDYVLVVGLNSSVCMLPFSDGKGNWVRNCIYFTDDQVESQYNENVGGHDVGVFNLEDGKVHRFFPNLELLHPPPIWLFSQNFIC